MVALSKRPVVVDGAAAKPTEFKAPFRENDAVVATSDLYVPKRKPVAVKA